jgi:hypothetical protein
LESLGYKKPGQKQLPEVGALKKSEGASPKLMRRNLDSPIIAARKFFCRNGIEELQRT